MKERDTVYYYLNDLDIIGKDENFVCYIYVKEEGWKVDNDNLVMDRIMDYGLALWASIDDITEDQANAFITLLESGDPLIPATEL